MNLKDKGRYDTHGADEGEFEPGSNKRILKNLLGIRKKRDLDKIEGELLEKTQTEMFDIYDENYQFTAADICEMHQIWLNTVYSWAGKYRSVNLGKGGFMFAAATQIPKLMTDFEKHELKKFTPCKFDTTEEIATALATVHTEFILIHPFREGNGRLGRLLTILMASQAGLPSLNFDQIKGKKRQEYFAAVRAGLERNYEPMEKIFHDVILRSIKFYQNEP
jgi:cell filamentation protein